MFTSYSAPYPDHPDLHNISSRSLDRCIHSDPFPELSLHKISGFEFRHGSASAEQRNCISTLFCLCNCLILQIHDELVVETAPEEKQIIEDILVQEMTHAADLAVVLDVDCHSGSDWFDAKG